MKCVEVRGVKIGEGIPKIIVPIVGTTEKEILDAAVSLRGAVMDLTEWRADYFDGVFDFAKVERVLKELRKELGSIPILFTFRTAGEGGEKDIRPGKDRSEGSGLGIEADSREFLTRDE